MGLSAGHTHLFMLNNEGDLTDEEEEEKAEEEIVGELFGEGYTEEEKHKYDAAATKIQQAFKKKQEADNKAKSKVTPYLSSQKNKNKESIYERRRKEAEEKKKQEEIA